MGGCRHKRVAGEITLPDATVPGSVAPLIDSDTGTTAADAFEAVNVDPDTMSTLRRTDTSARSVQPDDRPTYDGDPLSGRRHPDANSGESAEVATVVRSGGWLAGLWGLVRGVGRRHVNEDKLSRRR